MLQCETLVILNFTVDTRPSGVLLPLNSNPVIDGRVQVLVKN